MPDRSQVRLGLAFIASLSFGLAPIYPEPHLVGKLRWVAGGAVGMAPMDWADLVLHGLPWLWLAVELVRFGVERARAR